MTGRLSASGTDDETSGSPRGPTWIPTGTVVVFGGVMVSGLTTYAFVLLPARSGLLSPADYAYFAAAWFVVFAVVTGLLTPLEQDITRLVAAQEFGGDGARESVRRLIGTIGGLVALFVIAVVGWQGTLADHLFGERGLAVVTAGSVAGYLVFQALRGVLAGSGQFSAYAALLAIDGVLRLAGGAVLIALSVNSTAAYGLLIGAPPLVTALVVGWSRGRSRMRAGRRLAWSEVGRRLGLLVGNQMASQTTLNVAPLLAPAMARASEQKEAGQLAAGFLIARVPLFLFQAVQTAILPQLVELVAQHEPRLLRREVVRLCLLVGAVGLLGTLVSATLGPPIVALSFGEEFRMPGRVLGGLVAGTVVFALAMTVTLALIAMDRLTSSIVGWLVGAFTILVVILRTGGSLGQRVTIGFLVGTACSFILLALALHIHVNQWRDSRR